MWRFSVKNRPPLCDGIDCPKGWGSGTRPYRIWKAMRLRCHYPSHAAYARYSAAGIVVCAEWFFDYEPFMLWAMQSGYRNDLELDRRDNREGYSPENCRWVTRSQNQRNRSDNLAPIEAFFETKTLIEWL